MPYLCGRDEADVIFTPQDGVHVGQAGSLPDETHAVVPMVTVGLVEGGAGEGGAV